VPSVRPSTPHSSPQSIAVRLELLPGATLDEARARQKLNERLETVGLRDEVEIELEVVPRLA
jgi:hypothetical protein